MKLTQKRTCNRCRALESSPVACDLNYHIDFNGHTGKATPLEKCHKPLTIHEYLQASRFKTPYHDFDKTKTYKAKSGEQLT